MTHLTGTGLRALFAGLAGVTAIASAANADVAEFYKDRNVTILMRTGPGGSFDLYARILAPHLARHIPGNPNIVIEHMPGAGGVNAANFIYSVAPQDGTRILQAHAIPLAEKLRPGGVRFESAKFNWLGAFDEIVQTVAVWHEAPVKTLEDLKSTDIIFGSMAKNHLTYQWGAILQENYGATYKMVTGYGSGGALNIAMENGEIQAWAASWENLVGTRPHWLKENKVRVLAQFTMERSPALPDVPTLLELSPPDKRDMAEFLVAGTPIARAMAVGPDVPAERVAALRKAFADAMADPALLAEAKKRNVSIRPRTAEEVHKLVDTIVGASPELVERVKKAVHLSE